METEANTKVILQQYKNYIMYILYSKGFMGGKEYGVNEKAAAEVWRCKLGWGIIQMNGRFHELGIGSLRKSYGHGRINDPHIPQTEIKLILYTVLASDN